jgi:hypothetical protein
MSKKIRFMLTATFCSLILLFQLSLSLPVASQTRGLDCDRGPKCTGSRCDSFARGVRACDRALDACEIAKRGYKVCHDEYSKCLESNCNGYEGCCSKAGRAN